MDADKVAENEALFIQAVVPTFFASAKAFVENIIGKNSQI